MDKQTVETLLQPVNPIFAGFGPIDGVYLHDPQAYAIWIQTFLNLGMIEDAVRAGDWLVCWNADHCGWTDNFEAGSAEPLTRYGVTIGFVADALHNLSEATQNVAYRENASHAILNYAQYMDERGLHWYSDGLDREGSKDRRVIPNVTAVLCGATQQIADATDHKGLQALAQKNLRGLMSVADETDDAITWPYLEGRPKENDFNHAAMTLYGLLRCGVSETVSNKLMNALRACVRDGVIYRYNDRANTVRARSHGLGIALVCARMLEDSGFAQLILANLPDYKDGVVYTQWAGDTKPYHPRIQARVCWGLSQS